MVQNVLSQVGQPYGSAIGSTFGQAGQIGRTSPFNVDPITAAYAQQAQQQALQQALQQIQQQAQQQPQFAPQAWSGNILGQMGQPYSGTMGSAFGQAGQIGRTSQFNVDPIAAAYAQQALQQAQQQALQQAQQQSLQQAQQQALQQALQAQQASGYQGGQAIGAPLGAYGGQTTLH